MSLTIVVRTLPAPQGSKKYIGTSKSGHGIMVDACKRTKPFREAIKWEALATRAPGMSLAPWIRGPVEVNITFTLPKPKSAPKRRRTFADRKPDIDKLCRAVLDALTEVGALEDDARVVSLKAQKVFPGEDLLVALACSPLDVPGAVIKVRSVSE